MSLALVRSESQDVSHCWSQPVGMAQLAERSISEHWVLRECGDRHWNLLAEAMGLSTPHFTSEDGRPLYAAFCATELELAPCPLSHLGRDLVGHSTLYGTGRTRTASDHILTVNGEMVARLKMMSAFVGHDDSGRNASIGRRAPSASFNLPAPPAELSRFCERSLAASRRARAGNPARHFNTRLTPCPSVDFNAVGLMYFASYSALANRALWDVLGASGLPRKRRIIYLGNVDRGDPIDVQISMSADNRRHWTFFRSDSSVLAQGEDEL